MKARYRIVIKKLSTSEIKKRELLLEKKQYNSLKDKQGKCENGYQLVDILHIDSEY